MGVPDVRCAPLSQARSSINGVDLGLGIIGVIGVLIFGIMTGAAAISVAALTPATLAIWAVAMIASCLFAINLIHKAMDVLFHYKLACIDGERCALGQVMKIELNPDGDTTFNMKLAPIQDSPAKVTTVAEFQSSFQGKTLVYSDPGSATRGWTFHPELGGGVVSPTQPIPLFHCEIEGTYLNDWLTGLIALLWTLIAIATAAIALAALELIPVIGWIIWAVVALIALFAALLGIHMSGDASSQGSADPDVPVGDQLPGDDGPVLTDAANNKVAVGDYIVLTGLHALDCGHAEDSHNAGTWCEIHPVRGIAKINQAVYDTYSNAKDDQILDRYCNALKNYLGTDGAVATAEQPLEHPRIG